MLAIESEREPLAALLTLFGLVGLLDGAALLLLLVLDVEVVDAGDRADVVEAEVGCLDEVDARLVGSKVADEAAGLLLALLGWFDVTAGSMVGEDEEDANLGAFFIILRNWLGLSAKYQVIRVEYCAFGCASKSIFAN